MGERSFSVPVLPVPWEKHADGFAEGLGRPRLSHSTSRCCFLGHKPLPKSCDPEDPPSIRFVGRGQKYDDS